MKKAYLIKENAAIKRILKKTYPALLKALQNMHPMSKELIENETFSQAHDVLALIQTGHLKVEWLDGFEDRYLVLTVKEGE